MNEDDIVEAAMGAGALAAISRALTSREPGCPHGDMPQVMSATGVASTCWSCAWTTAAVEQWAHGPCSVCNAAAAPADREWMVEPRDGLVVAVKLCPVCSNREVTEPKEGERPMPTQCCEGCIRVALSASTMVGSPVPYLHAECATLLTRAFKTVTPINREERIRLIRGRYALARAVTL